LLQTKTPPKAGFFLFYLQTTLKIPHKKTILITIM
jgi:hypothetical protein